MISSKYVNLNETKSTKIEKFCIISISLQWNYFDDCTVTEKKIPGFGGNASGDYSSAYILFYQRAGNIYKDS